MTRMYNQKGYKMKMQTKQARISAAFFAGNITLKQANRLAQKTKRAAMHKGGKRHNRGGS